FFHEPVYCVVAATIHRQSSCQELYYWLFIFGVVINRKQGCEPLHREKYDARKRPLVNDGERFQFTKAIGTLADSHSVVAKCVTLFLRLPMRIHTENKRN